MVNSNRNNHFFLAIGIIGAFVLLFGLEQSSESRYFAIGALFLLATAIHYKLIYFIALELIMLSGHGGRILGIGVISEFALPLLLCLQLLIFYILSGQLNNLFIIIGIIGIALLSVGFSYQSNLIFMFGGLCVAIYSFYSVYQGKKIALLWGILNLLFAFSSLVKLI